MHPSLVIDSTHPYAAEVTKNIRKACEETKRNMYVFYVPEVQRIQRMIPVYM